MQFFRSRKRDEPTPAEWETISLARRAALAAATRQVTNGEPLPVEERWGWTAKAVVVGRDRDGCLLLQLWVRDPQGVIRLSRKVRLVPREELPGGLGSELRET